MSDLTKHFDTVKIDVPSWLDITDWPAYRAWLDGVFTTEEEYKTWLYCDTIKPIEVTPGNPISKILMDERR